MRRTIALLTALTAAAWALPAAEKMSYIFKRGDRAYIVTGHVSIHNIGSLTNRWKGDYLWAKISGQEYLIRDQATMNEARDAFVHVEAHQEIYHALEAKLRPIEKRYDALEERHDDLTDELSDNPEDYTEVEEREMERRIRELEQQMRPLEQQLRELEREEEVLDDRQEVLEEAAEKTLEEIIRQAIRQGRAERV